MPLPAGYALASIALAASVFAAGCGGLRSSGGEQAADAAPRVTHGVAVGDVTASTAVVWARADRAGWLAVDVSLDASFTQVETFTGSRANASSDFTSTAALRGLAPDTLYHYRARFGGPLSRAGIGRFRTAPVHADPRSVTFVFGGDLGGQEICRRDPGGYEIFDAMRRLEPDFFIANGDMIYADGACPRTPAAAKRAGLDSALWGWKNVDGGFARITDPRVDWSDPAALAENIHAHWRYNRADQHFQRFLSEVPMIAQWDDHEVVNDFGAQWSRYRTGIGEPSGYANLVEAGRRGFMNYAAIDTDRLDTDRIHRAFRWGAALDVFVIDARSHRSRNDLPDRAETGKTLLGAEQLDWLSAGLESSKAVWKVVSSDVPMSIPTGTHAEVAGNDGWAGDETGFERELRRLLARLDAADVTNLVFVTTDVHRAAVIGYSFDADGDGDPLVWHEIVTGPLNAGAAPRLVQSDLDPTFHPKLLYSEGSFFNFGQVTVARLRDGRMGLRAAVRDTAGEVRPGSLLKLEPQ